MNDRDDEKTKDAPKDNANNTKEKINHSIENWNLKLNQQDA